MNLHPQSFKWLAGVCAFMAPAALAALARHLDRSAFRHHPTYTALIPIAALGSLVLAAFLPAALIIRTRVTLPGRLGMLLGLWCLLVVQLYVVFWKLVIRP